MMKAAIVLTFDLPATTPGAAGDTLARILQKIDPPSLGYFDGDARVSVGPDADALIAWLDE